MKDPEDCDCGGSGFVVCHRCHGEGFILTCIDDICRGAGECMHGDGEDVCPVCNGDGSVACECSDEDCEPA